MSSDISEEDRMTAQRLLSFFEQSRSATIARTKVLVELESPSGDLEGSRAVVEVLADAAQQVSGVTSVERIESPNYGEHLRVRAFGDGGSASGDSILLVGHTDTVHARGSILDRPWRREGNRIYGPGIFDMKANCALVIDVLRAFAELEIRPSTELVLLLTCDEETGSDTGRELVEAEARRARCALVLEPPATGGRVKTGRKGTGIFRMEAIGIAAHAGLEPEKGASAILELARQTQRLHALGDLSKGISVNVGVVSGGTRSNVVAASAVAEIDLRFSTMDDGTRIEREILSSKPFDERVKLLVTGGVNRPPLERNEPALALYEKARRVASALDFDLGEAQVGGASDGNFIAAMGVPVLDGMGVDGDGAHAEHEHIIVDDIARRGALIGGLIAILLDET
jgi:glutamate carboxypeptidase